MSPSKKPKRPWFLVHMAHAGLDDLTKQQAQVLAHYTGDHSRCPVCRTVKPMLPKDYSGESVADAHHLFQQYLIDLLVSIHTAYGCWHGKDCPVRAVVGGELKLI
jgi:hypothetical protein